MTVVGRSRNCRKSQQARSFGKSCERHPLPCTCRHRLTVRCIRAGVSDQVLKAKVVHRSMFTHVPHRHLVIPKIPSPISPAMEFAHKYRLHEQWLLYDIRSPGQYDSVQGFFHWRSESNSPCRTISFTNPGRSSLLSRGKGWKNRGSESTGACSSTSISGSLRMPKACR